MRHGGADLGTPVRLHDLIDGICRQRTLNFVPGTRFLYSDSNFLLLGLIVERLSGETLEAFLERRVFPPLGMCDTRLTAKVADAIPDLATGYFPDGPDRWTRAAHAFPLHGEGGLVSSVMDLALWARNFDARRIGAAWLDDLPKQTPFANGTVNRYARGLVVRSYRGLETVSQGGLWPGYKTEFLRVPGRGLAVIAISNAADSDPNLAAHRALDAVRDGSPGVHPVPALPPRETLEPLQGCYVDPATSATLDVGLSAEGKPTLALNGLTVSAEAMEDGRLASPRSSSVFFVRAAGPDAVEVEQDAGTIGIWHRAPAGAALPEDLPGAYRSDEMATTWTLTEEAGAMSVRAAGPVVNGPAWEVDAIAPDLLRLQIPGALFRAWLDVRVLRESGRITALEARGARQAGDRPAARLIPGTSAFAWQGRGAWRTASGQPRRCGAAATSDVMRIDAQIRKRICR
ncbi:serine hydrolase domain-containing protein [Roseomonas sp. CCTCC AB2023176]|uniref:serine hydrolase domain-containing protein n=1 Tax=Roseomonas sp. CCTCC AB2023176 TaxID=3342640 RepID=UPI0035E36C4E